MEKILLLRTLIKIFGIFKLWRCSNGFLSKPEKNKVSKLLRGWSRASRETSHEHLPLSSQGKSHLWTFTYQISGRRKTRNDLHDWCISIYFNITYRQVLIIKTTIHARQWEDQEVQCACTLILCAMANGRPAILYKTAAVSLSTRAIASILGLVLILVMNLH